MGFAKTSGKPCQKCWTKFSNVSTPPDSLSELKKIAIQHLGNHPTDNVLIYPPSTYIIIKCSIRFVEKEAIGRDIEKCSTCHANGVVSFDGVKRICEFCHRLGYNSEDSLSRINEYRNTHHFSYQMGKDNFRYNLKECLTSSPEHDYVNMVFINESKEQLEPPKVGSSILRNVGLSMRKVFKKCPVIELPPGMVLNLKPNMILYFKNPSAKNIMKREKAGVLCDICSGFSMVYRYDKDFYDDSVAICDKCLGWARLMDNGKAITPRNKVFF